LESLSKLEELVGHTPRHLAVKEVELLDGVRRVLEPLVHAARGSVRASFRGLVEHRACSRDGAPLHRDPEVQVVMEAAHACLDLLDFKGGLGRPGGRAFGTPGALRAGRLEMPLYIALYAAGIRFPQVLLESGIGVRIAGAHEGAHGAVARAK